MIVHDKLGTVPLIRSLFIMLVPTVVFQLISVIMSTFVLWGGHILPETEPEFISNITV